MSARPPKSSNRSILFGLILLLCLAVFSGIFVFIFLQNPEPSSPASAMAQGYTVVNKSNNIATIKLENNRTVLVQNDVLAKIEKNESVQVIVETGDASLAPSDQPVLVQTINNDTIGTVLPADNSTKSSSSSSGGSSGSSTTVYIDLPVYASTSETIPLIQADLARETFNISGEGYAICLLDSGVNASAIPYAKVVSGYDYINWDSDASDDNGHGTYLASVISKVAPNVTIISVKVLDSSGAGHASNVINGINYCKRHASEYNIKAISMSLGGGRYTGYCVLDPMANAVKLAHDQGFTMIASTGNNGASYMTSPACVREAIAVASSSKSDIVSSFSNMNGMVDLLAPGESVTADGLSGPETKSGTSISVAHVAGATALLLEMNSSMTPDDLDSRFKNTGKLIEYNGANYSRLDVFSAIMNTRNAGPTNQTVNESNETYDDNYTAAVDISVCSNATTNGTYILTADLVGAPSPVPTLGGNACILVLASNVTLDCNGHTITNNVAGTTYGIGLGNNRNITVKNCPSISNYSYGVYLYHASDSIVTNVTTYSASYGIYLSESSSGNNTVKNSRASGGYYGITVGGDGNDTIYNNTANGSGFYGIYVSYSSYNNISKNTVNNGVQNGYLFDHAGWNTITENIAHSNAYNGFQIMYSSANNTFANNSAYNNTRSGFYTNDTRNNTFSRNRAYLNQQNGFLVEDYSPQDTFDSNLAYSNILAGIMTNYSNAMTSAIFINNTAYNNSYGIFLKGSQYNNLTNNTVYMNTFGYLLTTSNYNNFTSNYAYNNTRGYYLNLSHHNVLSGGYSVNNSQSGFMNGDSINTSLDGITFYGNKYGFIANNSLGINTSYLMTNCVFKDNVAQTNLSKISANDTVIPNEIYAMNWSYGTTIPSDHVTVLSKRINLTDLNPTFQPASIDRLTMSWDNSELSGFNEPDFQLYKVNSTGTYLLNYTPNTASNELSAFNVQNLAEYGIFEDLNCRAIEANDTTYTMDRNFVGTGRAGYGSGLACVRIIGSNVTFDCNKYNITDDGAAGTHYGIYVADALNVTVRNCGNISDYDWGVYFNNAVNSTIRNVTAYKSAASGFNLLYSDLNALTDLHSFTNSASGIGLSMAESEGNTIQQSSFHNSQRGVWVYSNSNSNNFFSNNVYSNTEEGFVISDSISNALIGNNVYSNTNYGFFLDSVSGSVFNLGANDIYSNKYGIFLNDSTGVKMGSNIVHNNNVAGIYILDSNLTNLTYNKLYNNSVDFKFNNTLASGVILNMSWSAFLNPAGTLFNYTNLSIDDTVTAGSAFTINWTRNSSANPGHRSFGNKFVNITTVTGSVSLDKFVIWWNAAEETEYGLDSSTFGLWEYHGGTWTDKTTSLDTVNRKITATNLVPASDYGIMDSGGVANCQEITSSGSYAQTTNLVGAPINASPLTNFTCIKIATSNVTFDCNGYSIINNGTAGTTFGIVVNGSASNITIRNCNISNYTDGISIDKSNRVSIINTLSHNNTRDGITYSFDSYYGNVTGSQAYNNSRHGFVLSSHGYASNNSAYYNDAYNFFTRLNYTLSDNTAYGGYGQGFLISEGSNNLTNNTAFNLDAGFHFLAGSSSNVLTGNTAHNITAASGFDFPSDSYYNVLRNNIVYNTSNHGFAMASHNILINNTAHGNGVYNFYMVTNNTLVNNTAYGDAIIGQGYVLSGNSNNMTNNSAYSLEAGFHFLAGSSSNVLTGNTAHNITAASGFDFPSDSYYNVLRNNIVYNTSNHGFAMASHNILINNTAHGNGVYNFYMVTNNTLVNNTAYGDAIIGQGYVLSGNSNNMTNNSAYSLEAGFHFLAGSSSNVLTGNTAHNITAASGFDFPSDSSYNILTSNSAYNTSIDGFLLYSHNILINNTAHGNGVYNFFVMTNNTLVNNTAYGDNLLGQGFVMGGGSNNLTNNTAYALETGFHVTAGANTITFDGNVAHNISGDAFYADPASYYHTFRNNLAYNYSGIGFHIYSNSIAINNTAYSRTGIYGLTFLSNNIAANNTAHDQSSTPFLIFGNNNSIINNTGYNSTAGFYLTTATNSTFEGNTAYGNNGQGVIFDDSNGINASNTHLYNNTQDLYVSNSLGYAVTLNLSNLIFDNPAGTLINYTNLSLYDSVAASSSYSINFTRNTTANSGYKSFRNKFVNISAISGSVSLDNVTWNWVASEESGYSPASFSLWKYNASGWTQQTSAVLDTGNRNIRLASLVPASDYGIMDNGVSYTDIGDCVNITSSGLYQLNTSLFGYPNAGTCIRINASNVLLDCRNYNFTGNGVTSNVRAILVNNVNNVTVRNCNITNYTSSSSAAIELRNTTRSVAENNRLYYNANGILLQNYNLGTADRTVYNTLNNNIICNNSYDAIDLYGRNVSYNNITSNYLCRSRYGIYLTGGATPQDYNYYFNNTVFNNTYGIYMPNGDRSTFANNNATMNANYGFYFSAYYALNVSNNYASFNNGDGFTLDLTNPGVNYVFNNTAYNNSGSGFRIPSTGSAISNVTFILNNATNNILDGFGMGNQRNRLYNNTAFNNYIGIEIYYAGNHTIIDNYAQENRLYDFFINPSSTDNCVNNITNLTGSGNRPIGYLNSSVNYGNTVLSELLLCNADYSNVTNVTVLGSDLIRNNGILLVATDYATLANSTSSNNRVGVDMGYNSFTGSTNNVISGSNMTNNTYGISIVTSSSSSNNFTSNIMAGNDYGLVINNTGTMNRFESNIFKNSPIAGIYFRGTANFTNDRMFNNTRDFWMVNLGVAQAFNMTKVVFDNPSDNFANFTNVSMYYSASTSGQFILNWTSRPATLPANHISVNDKYLRLTHISGLWNLNNLAFHWNDTDAGAPFDENYFELWNYTASGWINMGATLNAAANTLNVSLVTAPAGSRVFGILENLPSACPTISTSGTTTQTQNITGAPNSVSALPNGGYACVKIASSDVIYDCNGYSITDDGTGTGLPTYGIAVYGSSGTPYTNVTIKNCPSIKNYTYGIYLSYTNNSNVINTTARDAYRYVGSAGGEGAIAYFLRYSGNNYFADNSAFNNTLSSDTAWGNPDQGGIGYYLTYSDNNTFTNSNATNNTIAATNWITTRSGGSGYYLATSNLNKITNSNATNNWVSGSTSGLFGGIVLSGGSDNLISNNSVRADYYGLTVSGSSNANVTGNDFSDNNMYGAYMEGPTGFNISGNSFDYGFYGIWASSADSMTFSNNNASSTSYAGFYMSVTNSNFSNNNASYNTNYGIYFVGDGNRFIGDTFAENEYYDFYPNPGSSSQCNNYVSGMMGSGNRPINYTNETVTWADGISSEIIICNAINSVITNMTVDGSDTLYNNGFRILFTDDATIQDSSSINNREGFYVSSSSGNFMESDIASNDLDYGFYDRYDSSSTTFANCQAINTSPYTYYGGFYIESTGPILESNTASGNSYIGFNMYYTTAPGSFFNNTAYGTTPDQYGSYGAGIRLYSAEGLNISNSTLYNNTYDLYAEAAWSTYNYYLSDTRFLNPSGTDENLTVLSLTDNFASPFDGSVYYINWTSQPPTLPNGRTSFHDKYVDIGTLSGTVNIDTVIWPWNASEESGFDPSLLEVWEYSIGTWTNKGATLDTGARTLTVTSLIPGSQYGVFEGAPETCFEIPANGTYELNQSVSGAPINTGEIEFGSTACIKIGASDVIFDCKNFTIDYGSYPSPSTTFGIAINQSANNVTVKNCMAITNYTVGVIVGDAYGTTATTGHNITNVSVFGGGIGFKIESVWDSSFSYDSANGTASEGFLLQYNSSNNALSHNTANNSGFYGFHVYGLVGGIESPTLIPSNNTFVNNTASNGAGDGFNCQPCILSNFYNNTAVSNSPDSQGDGFRLRSAGFMFGIYSYNNTFINNTATGNYVGFHILQGANDNNVLIDNTASDNRFTYSTTSGAGFWIGSSNNLLIGNNASGSFRNFRIVTGSDNHLINNTARDGAGAGFLVTASSNEFTGNLVFNNSEDGISLNSNVGPGGPTNDNNLTDNIVYGNGIGISIINAGGTQLVNDQFFNNTKDFLAAENLDKPISFNATNLIFTNPSGSLQNFSNLSIIDTMDLEMYVINWAAGQGTFPSGRNSFRDKYVNISTLDGAPSIDNISFQWRTDELTGFDESKLELWKFDGTWNQEMSAVLDQPNNLIYEENLVPGSDYALFENNELGNCPVINESGTVTMTGDMSGQPNDASPLSDFVCVKIAASDVIFDCAGYSITGTDGSYGSTNTTYGILLNGSLTNVTIKNCPAISNYTNGVYVYYSNNSLIQNVTSLNNSINGFSITHSSSNTLIDNAAYDNLGYNYIVAGGVTPGTTLNNTLTNNIAQGGRYGFYLGATSYDRLINNTASGQTEHGFYLELNMGDNSFNLLENNTAYSNNKTGFYLFRCANDTLVNNTAYSNNQSGFVISFGTNNTFIKNTAYDNNDTGFSMSDAANSTFINNSAYFNVANGFSLDTSVNITLRDGFSYGNPTNGILVTSSSYNATISGNTVWNSTYGILVSLSDSATISNNLAYNTSNGISLGYSSYDSLSNNAANGNGKGFNFDHVSSSAMSNNSAFNNSQDGFYLGYASSSSFNNTVSRNNTQNGFYLDNSIKNSFTNTDTYGNQIAGFNLSSSDDVNITNVTSYSNGYAIYMTDSNNTNITNAHIYGSSARDLQMYAHLVNMNVHIRNMTIDNAIGNFDNHTVIDVEDKMEAPEAYSINWSSAPAALPDSNHRSFENKYLNISVVTSPGVFYIDNITFRWDNSELPGYNENKLQLWKYNASGWNQTSATLDISANSLNLQHHNPRSVYGILENNATVSGNCPEITSGGTVVLTQNQEGAQNIPTPLTNYSCVNIQADDVTLDCNNFNITGGIHDSGNVTYGIFIGCGVNNTKIKNCPGISNYSYGIYVCQSDYTNISNVEVFNNSIDGIYIDNSDNVTLDNAHSHDNGNNGMTIDPSSSGKYNQFTGDNNGGSGLQIQGGSNNQFSGVTLYNNNKGAEVLNSQIFNITGGSSYNNAQEGIIVINSTSVTLKGLSISGNAGGITLEDGTTSTLMSLTFSNNNNLDFVVDGTANAVTYTLNESVFVNSLGKTINMTVVHGDTAEKYAMFGNIPATSLPAGMTNFPVNGGMLNITLMVGVPTIPQVSINYKTSDIGGFNMAEVKVYKTNDSATWVDMSSIFVPSGNSFTATNLNSFSQYGPFGNGTAYAQGMTGANVTAGNQTRWAGMNASNVTTEGGNLTDLDINMTAVTDRWAAFYGNVTGTLALKEAGYPAYAVYEWNWSAIDNGGFVCVSENPTYNFLTIDGATPSEIDTAWGFDSYSDNAINTFNNGSCTVNLAASTATATERAKTGLDNPNDPFATCPMKSPTSTPISSGDQLKFAFCSPIMGASGYSWKNESINFEMIVPTAAGDGTETYYFFAQLY